LGNAVNQYQEADKLAGRFADRLQQTAAGELPEPNQVPLPARKG
jgi:hypothetical protein